MKGCVDPETRDELQAAMDTLQANSPAQKPRVFELCKGTSIKFKEGDSRLYIVVPNGQSLTLQCAVEKTCTIDGGNTGRHEKGSREQVGSGGFIENSSFSKTGYYLTFIGITFQNFGVSNDGGVFKFFVGGAFYLSFLKCDFKENYSKFHGGAIMIEIDDGRFGLYMKDCNFKKNNADGFGGAIGIRNYEGAEEVWIRGSDFTQNWAKTSGGAIALVGERRKRYRKTFINECKFIDNKAWTDGGGIHINDSHPFKMKNSEFHRNTAGRHGQAYFAYDCNIEIDDVDVNYDTVVEFDNNFHKKIAVVKFA